MTAATSKLLAAASQLGMAAADCADWVREPGTIQAENVDSGDTATIVADALRLILEATDQTDRPLYAAVMQELSP